MFPATSISTPARIQSTLDGESSENHTTYNESPIPNTVLSGLRVKYMNRIIIPHLNVNSIRKSLICLQTLLGKN